MNNDEIIQKNTYGGSGDPAVPLEDILNLAREDERNKTSTA